MELGGAAGLGVDGTRALTAEGSWKSGWGLVSPMGAVSSAGTNAGRVCRRSNECPMNGSFIGARRRGGCGRRWNARADGRRQLFFGLGPWLVHTCCLCPLALRKRGRFRRRSNECPMNGAFIGARRRGGRRCRWNARAHNRRQLGVRLGSWSAHGRLSLSLAWRQRGRVCRRSNECPMNGSFIGARRRGGRRSRWNARADDRRQLEVGLGPWPAYGCCLSRSCCAGEASSATVPMNAQ